MKSMLLGEKKVNFILKRYKQAGREVFESVFPEGVTIEAMDNVVSEAKTA